MMCIYNRISIIHIPKPVMGQFRDGTKYDILCHFLSQNSPPSQNRFRYNQVFLFRTLSLYFEHNPIIILLAEKMT
jgi:hypothetical protein